MNDEWDDSAASGAPRQDSHQSWRNKNSGEDGWSDGNSAWSNQPGYGGSRDHIPSQQFSRGRGGGGGGGGYRGSRDGGDRYGNGGGGGGSGYRGSRDGGDRYGNGGGGGGGGRNFNQNRRDDKFEVIYVPSMKVGRVIGRGGSKINELQSDSGARIQVTKDTDGDNTIVKIFGNDDCVARAKELIEDLTTER